MLVLSRKIQESVVVNGTDAFDRKIIVTVLEIKGGKVRLGFDADAEVPVHRLEVWERIHAGSRTPNAEVPVHRLEVWERIHAGSRTPNPQQRAPWPKERVPYCD